MDHEQRTNAANRQDPLNAARIVRGISQIEADFFHAAGPVSETMMREAVQAIRTVAVSPWQVVETGLSAQVVCPEWKMTKGVGTGDMWLELAELSSDEDDEDDHSWLAAAVKAGSTQLCVELMFRRGLQDQAEAVIGDDKAVAALGKLGFKREAEGTLVIPIDIPAEALAQGFEQNDLGQALAPVGKAFAKAIAAKAELSTLLEKVRADARRR